MKRLFLIIAMLLVAANVCANATEDQWVEEASKACHDINISKHIAHSKEATAFFHFFDKDFKEELEKQKNGTTEKQRDMLRQGVIAAMKNQMASYCRHSSSISKAKFNEMFDSALKAGAMAVMMGQ